MALTIGEHELSNAEFSYYYIDAVNKFTQDYGSYMSLVGLDTTKALDEQEISEGYTWADDFIESAAQNARSIYALNDEAKAVGFTLSDEDIVSIDSTFSMMELYATYNYGYADLQTYLKAMYGSGATVESYRNYYEMSVLAQNYEAHYADNLSYTNEQLRAEEAEDYNLYSSYSYTTYYQSVSAFHGAEATDAEIEQARKLAENEVNKLVEGEYASADDLKAAIADMDVNQENASTPYSYDNVVRSGISSTYAEWVTDSSRKAGDVTSIASTSTDADGNEVVNGYYVVYFSGSNDNEFALANVRHILVKPEGGSYDSETGATTYSEEEMAAAKKAAEELYAQWKSGEATEDSFAALANEHSDDGDGTTGGLYENVYPGQMVTAFNDWCFDESRQPGDTGIVETEYGYHVMYYVGESDTNYRDYMIENDLREADLEAWYNATVDAMTTAEGDTKYIAMDVIISAN